MNNQQPVSMQGNWRKFDEGEEWFAGRVLWVWAPSWKTPRLLVADRGDNFDWFYGEGSIASKVVADAQKSGLSWDEAIGGLGLAAKALATGALHMSGQDDSIAHAHKRLEEGFSQKAQVIFGCSDISQLRGAYKDAADACFANANTKLVMKLH